MGRLVRSSRLRRVQVATLLIAAMLGVGASLVGNLDNRHPVIADSSGELGSLVGLPVAYVFDGALKEVSLEEDVFPGTLRTVGMFAVEAVVLDGSQESARLEGSSEIQEVPAIEAGSEIRIFLDVGGEPGTWGLKQGGQYRVWTNVLGNVSLNDARATPFVLGGAVDLKSDTYLEPATTLNGRTIQDLVGRFELTTADALLALAKDMSLFMADGTSGSVLVAAERVAAEVPATTPQEERDVTWAQTETWRRGFEPDVAPVTALENAAQQDVVFVIAPDLGQAYPDYVFGLRHSGGVAASVSVQVPVSPASILYLPGEPLEMYLGPFDLNDSGLELGSVTVKPEDSRPVLHFEVSLQGGLPVASARAVSWAESEAVLAASAMDATQATREVGQESEVLREE